MKFIRKLKILFYRNIRTIRRSFSIKYCGRFLVPKPFLHILSAGLGFLEPSLEPIKLPQMYMSIFYIFLLVSLQTKSKIYPNIFFQVLDIRDNEIKVLKKAAWLNAFVSFLWSSIPFIVALASFATYVLGMISHKNH